MTFRCDECGRFIPLSDFVNKRAIRVMLEPDSEFGPETWATLCRDHSPLSYLELPQMITVRGAEQERA